MMIWMLALLATQAVPLQPSGPWELSTTQTGCQIVRVYGADKPVQIGFKATLLNMRRSFLITGPKKFLPSGIGDINIALDDQQSIRVNYGSFEVSDNSLRQLEIFPDGDQMLHLTSSSSIKISDFPVIQILEVKAALGALNKCTTDLLASWGVDPALYLNGKMAEFQGEISKFFSWQDYPKEALAKGISGRVTLLLKTRPDGTIDECKAVASPDTSLDAGSCAIAVRRLRLKPPLDEAGRAMASYAILPLHWSLGSR